MHNASFEKLGLDYVYLAFDVVPETLEQAVAGMKDMGFAGYNVTMPNKTHVLPYLDELTEAAELMGAVNTVVIKDGKSIGHNTDGAGFVVNLKNHGVDFEGKKITIVGAGGEVRPSSLSLLSMALRLSTFTTSKMISSRQPANVWRSFRRKPDAISRLPILPIVMR